ncbi:MAG: NAD-dependent epimerase/dehydratase family protein [Chlorobium sp.]
MKIVVLGGGGFIGSAIIDRLLHDGHEIRVFERPRIDPYRSFRSEERVEWITGDLMSLHDIHGAIKGMDVVLHLISTTLPKSSNEDPIFDVQSNLVATLQLLDAMVVQSIRKIIFISSGGTIYGDPKYLPIDERHPTDPKVSYGITKLAIEKFLLLYQHQHGIKVNILRVANPYGERQRVETAQGAVAVFLNRALRKKTIKIWGDGSVIRDYIYIKDVADAFALALVYDGPHSVFNISTGYGTSLSELINMLECILGHVVPYVFHPARQFDLPVSILDNTLAKIELGWQPMTSLENGIVCTIDWMLMEMNGHAINL